MSRQKMALDLPYPYPPTFCKQDDIKLLKNQKKNMVSKQQKMSTGWQDITMQMHKDPLSIDKQSQSQFKESRTFMSFSPDKKIRKRVNANVRNNNNNNKKNQNHHRNNNNIKNHNHNSNLPIGHRSEMLPRGSIHDSSKLVPNNYTIDKVENLIDKNTNINYNFPKIPVMFNVNDFLKASPLQQQQLMKLQYGMAQNYPMPKIPEPQQ